MKIQNTTSSPNFHAGLTSKMRSEIAHCDVQKISAEFKRAGIPTKFRKNQVIAWCSLKCFQFIKELNNRYNLNLGLPSGIFVKDFEKLEFNINQTDALGLCNIMPEKINNGKKTIILPSKTLFFNEAAEANLKKGTSYWDNIDNESSYNRQIGLTGTDLFLETFFHEFCHAVHLDNLLKTISKEKYVQLVVNIFEKENLRSYQIKTFPIVYDILGRYSTTSPYETVSCDLTKRIANNINRETLMPKTDFITNSPYRPNHWTDIFSRENRLDKLIHKLWNGNFK